MPVNLAILTAWSGIQQKANKIANPMPKILQ